MTENVTPTLDASAINQVTDRQQLEDTILTKSGRSINMMSHEKSISENADLLDQQEFVLGQSVALEDLHGHTSHLEADKLNMDLGSRGTTQELKMPVNEYRQTVPIHVIENQGEQSEGTQAISNDN